MRRLAAAVLVLLAALALAMPAATGGAKLRAPERFFGIAPQTGLTPEDASYMKAGGIGVVRWPIFWTAVQPTANGPYDWSSFDETVATAARAGLRVFPSLGPTPRWLASKETTLPVLTARQRRAWTAFVEAAVRRYGPGGEFWRQRSQPGVNYEPALPRALPIRTWQIWNEANFFYFAFPVSPARYAKLVTISSKAIKRVDPGADVILAGLFGEPTASGKRGMPATEFLEQLYRRRGFKSRFDAAALHPYAVDAESLAQMTEEMRQVMLANGDRRAGLYITEMGWGSQNNFQQVAFEQGIGGQVRQLRDSYAYLLQNRNRLNLKGTFWFSWKDIRGSCNFCDSVGLFRQGARLRPKPSWHAFVRIAGGRPRP
jgi:hypothetical protein